MDDLYQKRKLAAVGAMLAEPTPEEQNEFLALCQNDPSVMDLFVQCAEMDARLGSAGCAPRKSRTLLQAGGAAAAIVLALVAGFVLFSRGETIPVFARAGSCSSDSSVVQSDVHGICDTSMPHGGVTLRLYGSTSVRQERTGGTLRLFVEQGSLLVQADKRKAGESLEVKTSRGTIQFLGTSILIQSESSQDRVEVIEGSVLYHPGETCSGSEIVVTEGTELIQQSCSARTSALSAGRASQLRAEVRSAGVLRGKPGPLDESSRTAARLVHGSRQRITLTDGTALTGTALQENGIYFVLDEQGDVIRIPEERVAEIAPLEDPE